MNKQALRQHWQILGAIVVYSAVAFPTFFYTHDSSLAQIAGVAVMAVYALIVLRKKH